MDLDIYGRVQSIEGRKELCPFRYPGQYEDTEIGLYYNRFRYYDPEGGQYVSQDPIGLEGDINLYSYVSDTTNFLDPFGLSSNSWNDFQNRMKGKFTKQYHLAGDNNLTRDAASGWKEYKNANKGGDTMVIGTLGDTKKYIGQPGYNVLDSKRWTIGVNDAWEQGGIDREAPFRRVSPKTKRNLWDKKEKRERVLNRELKNLENAGYIDNRGKITKPKTGGCGK